MSTADGQTSPIGRAMKELSISSAEVPFKVRDFGHPESCPLHFGVYPITSPTPSTTSDIDNLFPCHARAMYDFAAQEASELSFTEGTLIYVIERKYPGWLWGIIGEEEGLVPENYVCIEDGDSSDSDERRQSSASGPGNMSFAYNAPLTPSFQAGSAPTSSESGVSGQASPTNGDRTGTSPNMVDPKSSAVVHASEDEVKGEPWPSQTQSKNASMTHGGERERSPSRRASKGASGGQGPSSASHKPSKRVSLSPPSGSRDRDATEHETSDSPVPTTVLD